MKTQQNNFVSVLMPAYNCEKYVHQAIQCILNQTHTNIELLIADDGSIDNTRKIIDSYNDPRITRFHNIENIGYLKTWNKLISNAKGDYITFLDADDTCDLSRIEILLREFEKDPGLGVCGSNFKRIDDNGVVIEISNFKLDHNTIVNSMPNKYQFIGSALMISRSAYDSIGGYNVFFDRMGQEDHYWAYLVMSKFKTKNVPQHLYNYRFNPESVSGNLSNNPDKLHSQEIVKKLISQRLDSGTDMLEQGRQSELRTMLDEMNRPFTEDSSYIYYYVAKRRFYEGNKSLALKIMLMAIRKNPFKLAYYKDFVYFFRKYLYNLELSNKLPQNINISLPVNYEKVPPYLKSFFKSSYTHKDQPVLSLQNCFVTYNGIVLSNLQYVDCCFYEPSSYKKKYYLQTLKAIFLSYVTRWGRANKMVLPKTQAYAIIYQPYINYFHWVIESLTRYIILKNSGGKCSILMPRSLLKIPYIKDSLELLGIENITIIENDNLLKVEHLILPSMVRWGGHHNPEVLLQLRAEMTGRYKLKFASANTPERLLVKRTGRRKIVNFEELESCLSKEGFTTIDFEGMTLYDQISIMQNAKIVVAQHGAALTNMLFMPPEGTVVEIFINPTKLATSHLDDEYFNIAACLQHRYYACFSEPVNENGDFFVSDCIVDIATFEEQILTDILHPENSYTRHSI